MLGGAAAVVGCIGIASSLTPAIADRYDLVKGVLPPGVPVHAVDANASWARPATRLPDGVEELGQILRTITVGV